MDEITLVHKNGTKSGVPWGFLILVLWLAGNVALHIAGYTYLALPFDIFWLFMALGGIIHALTSKPVVRIHVKKNFISLYAPGQTQPFYSNSLSAVTYASNYDSLIIKDSSRYFSIKNSAFKELKSLAAFLENTDAKKVEYRSLERPTDIMDLIQEIIGAPYSWMLQLFRAN